MASITRRSRATTDSSPAAAMDRLVEAFERLLARGESFTTISVEELAREAGMARATFYLHCRNKGQLVSHAMQAVQLQLKTAARARLKKSGSYGRAEFQAFMREVVEILFRHRYAIWAMNEVSASRPDMKCVFINGEDFTNELIHYIYAKKNMSEFHNKYRSADLLIVDDIQFIKGKEQTQEEFFHTFNAVTQEGHQIVLSSDKPPKEMGTLDERLRTRFEWGLLADIQPPDFETRMAIIKQKARDLEFDIPDDVVQYIAEKVKSNIRQLEGAVKRMKAIVTIQGAAKNITTAQSAIKDILTESRPIPQTIEKIISEVARTYGANPADIRSSKRDAPISQMRQIAMYVVSEVTGLTQEAIGREFSGRHHTTVIYALREIKDKIDRDPSLKATVNDIIKNVQQA
ncbi:MAG: Chromosomal replication initiator protein DnaA [Firmicutes bacterium ADurb.Bin262]|nr:MAG: Chromosomal replication initiator protein DnaA [Firmicutes bacterium ADurb.Bin262]